MGSDKALLEYRGRGFLERLIYLLLPRVDKVVAVLGHNADRIQQALPEAPRLQVAVNREYDRGMLSSLQCGLAAAGGDVDWILWALVDHPAVRGRTLDRLLAVAATADAPLVIPRCGGTRGHPIMISKAVAAQLIDLDADSSPQDVVRAHYSRACFVDTDDRGVLLDIDNPADYAGLGPGSGR